MKKVILLVFVILSTFQWSTAQKYTGDANFFSQNALDLFGSYTEITGNLRLSGSDIDDLSKLRSLQKVGGDIFISGIKVKNLSDLNNLEEVAGMFQVTRNSSIESISGFSKLKTVGPLYISHNTKLEEIRGFNSLTETSKIIQIMECHNLINIDFSNLINANAVEIYTNDALSGVNFSSLRKVDNQFRLAYNSSLSKCCTLLGFLENGSAGSLAIWENKQGCDSTEEIKECAGHTVSQEIKSIGMTPWEFHEGHEGKIDFISRRNTSGTYEMIKPYEKATIPVNDDIDWQRAGMRNGKVYYEVPSQISSSEGGKKVDFTYFQTHVFVPNDVTINSFQVSVDRADDGARIYLENSRHYDSHHFDHDHDLVSKSDSPKAIELKDEIVKGADNRIIIVLYDDNPGAKRIDGIHIRINGEEVPLHSSNNAALHFDGTDDYIDTEGITTFYKNSFTIEGWIKPDVDASTGAIFNIFKDRVTAIYAEVISGGPHAGKIRVIYRHTPSNTGGFDLFSSETVNDGKWHHFALVKGDNDKLTLYVDGKNSATKPNTAADITRQTDLESLQFRIGKNVDGSSRNFKGAIDEIRCWNVAKSELDINRWMHRPLNGTETGLAIYYNFNEGIAESDNSPITKINNHYNSNYKGKLNGFDLNSHLSNFVHSLPIY